MLLCNVLCKQCFFLKTAFGNTVSTKDYRELWGCFSSLSIASCLQWCKLFCKVTSFIHEVSSRACMVVAEADLSLRRFWTVCSRSVETLKGELPLENIFKLSFSCRIRGWKTDGFLEANATSFWFLKNSLWQNEKQNREQNTGQVFSEHSHVNRSAISGWLTARRDTDVLGSTLWSCEAIQ